jgi:class 3 adenylate cyclase
MSITGKAGQILLILWMSFTDISSVCGQTVINLSPGTGLVNVGEYAGTFFDKTNDITADEIASGQYTGSFRYAHKQFISFGMHSGSSWCLFRLVNSGDERVYLSVHNPTLDTISLYKVSDKRASLIGSCNIASPLSSRQILTEDPMFDLKAGRDTATYLLHVTSFRHHLYSLKAGYLKDQIPSIGLNSSWNAAYIGFMLLIGLYNFFLFLSIRNRPYLYYSIYVVCMGIFNADLNGTAFLYFWPTHPGWNHAEILFSNAAGIFAQLFLLSFLDLKKYCILCNKIVWMLAVLYMLNLVLAALGFGEVSFMVIQPVTLCSLVMAVLSSITVWRKGYRPARFYVLASGSMILGVFVFLLSNRGLLPYGSLSERSIQLTSLIEALLLSFALADRVNTYRREKEQLIRAQNEILERKVAERTEELNKKRQESEELLLNILPADVAAELKETGVAQSRNYESVTVLFTDFKDFTSVVERISPELLVANLNECFSAFDKIIEKHGIEKIKTIGDSYMCAGGFNSYSLDSVINVVKAGLEMRDFMIKRNIVQDSNGGHVLEVRIGIHTGPVIAGIVGIKKFAYDIWGDTVNIASRMESASETNKVNISGTTYDIVKSHFKTVYRGKVPAKNKGDIDMYFVEWPDN